VVGYFSAIFTQNNTATGKEKHPMELTLADKKFLLETARKTVVARTGGQPAPEVKAVYPILNEERGAFVTLHKHGDLRGCIGYIQAYKPLLETILEMAESAALKDPRFPPVTSDEVDELDIEISVLSPLEDITDVSRIEVGIHGIIIEQGWHKGLLLPQVATEQQWDRDTFLSQTCIKAGLPPDAWKKKNTRIQIFSAEVFGEKELSR
jgi:AmmeMemoRadiSam system protein A